MRIFTAIVLIVVLVCVNAGIGFSTCARMDTPGLSKAARQLCINSCKFQKCGAGHCEKRGGRPTCVCSRCPMGRSWPGRK